MHAEVIAPKVSRPTLRLKRRSCCLLTAAIRADRTGLATVPTIRLSRLEMSKSLVFTIMPFRDNPYAKVRDPTSAINPTAR